MTITAPVDGDPLDPAWAQLITGAVNANVTTLATLTGTWTDYTPAWTASVNPAKGNGTLTGRYKQNGKTVVAEVFMQAGSTTTFGTGVWSFSLPTTALSVIWAGAAYILDAGTANRSAICSMNTSTTVFLISSADGDVSPTVPQTWANGDALRFVIIYEAA